MAQVVGYFENDVVYKSGPFVLCDFGGKYRIEVELKGHRCPVLPHLSIYRLLEKEKNYQGGFTRKETREPQVDWLNEQVKEGKIILQGKTWICPGFLRGEENG